MRTVRMVRVTLQVLMVIASLGIHAHEVRIVPQEQNGVYRLLPVVIPGDHFTTSPLTVNFGTLKVGGVSQQTLSITNTTSGEDAEIVKGSEVKRIKDYLTELAMRPSGRDRLMAVLNDHDFKLRIKSGQLTPKENIKAAKAELLPARIRSRCFPAPEGQRLRCRCPLVGVSLLPTRV